MLSVLSVSNSECNICNDPNFPLLITLATMASIIAFLTYLRLFFTRNVVHLVICEILDPSRSCHKTRKEKEDVRMNVHLCQ